jgi:hypothetical protein
MLLVEGNLVLQRSASFVPRISMKGRGAKGSSFMGLYDFSIPTSIQLSGRGWSKKQALDMIRARGYAICDRWLWDEWGRIDGVSAVAWTAGTVLLTATGCGAGAVAQSTGNQNGNAGGAGTNGAPGGGGSGGIGTSGASCTAAPGRPWGGGVASSGNSGIAVQPTGPDLFGGAVPAASAPTNLCGGGAGNPGGAGVNGGGPGQDGTGGILIIVVKGTTTLNAGAIIDADGMNGGNGSTNGGGGGGSGGGHVSLITLGTLTNNGTIQAAGGTAGTATYPGGAGGAGSVVTKTFAQMGW